jgi:hypothetical protein
MWYVSWKPVIMFILSAVFSGLSIVLIYADVSYCFGAQNNIIYNLVTEPDLNEASSYFEANVSEARICVNMITFFLWRLKLTLLYFRLCA